MVDTVPAFAKVRELRLGVRLAREDDPTRPLTRAKPYAVSMAERWEGDVLFSPLLSADARKLAAFIERLDGRVTPFLLTLKAGVFGAAVTATAALAAVPALGADTVSLTVTGGPIIPGTLFTVGDPQTGPFQLFEAVDVAGGLVTVAPRVRSVFTLASPVAVGTVTAKLCRAADQFDVAAFIGRDMLSLSVVEAL